MLSLSATRHSLTNFVMGMMEISALKSVRVSLRSSVVIITGGGGSIVIIVDGSAVI